MRHHREHTLIASIALGRRLKGGEEVHHVDGDQENNHPSNLVICPSRAYHKLLHIRTKALEETGNANYRKCRHCGRYDDPANMKFINQRGRVNYPYEHSVCSLKAWRAWYEQNLDYKKKQAEKRRGFNK